MNQKTMIERIVEWAEKTPKQNCYQENNKSYTYEELHAHSDSLAYELLQYDNQLPIIVYGGLEYKMLVAFLACVKTGHAYIPIDAHTPKDRIEMITNVADYTAVIAIAEWPLENEKTTVITSYQIKTIIKTSRKISLDKCVKGKDNFYIIFTSGTTGVPKGVQISHDNLVSYTDWMLNDFGLKNQSVFLAQAPYSFDLSVMNLYPSLLSGGTLKPLTKEVINDFKELFYQLPKMKLNVWVSTPSFVEICLMEPGFNGESMPEITHFLFCGEELTHTTAEKLLTRFPSATVYNTYGPTEATVAITWIEITSKILAEYNRLPIGKVKPDTEIIIMDETGSPLSEGSVGEIVIVGPSVSKGYLNNEEKTKEAFFMHEGIQAYRTGDAGVYQKGNLLYKGRMDFQIKLHGYRMELEDIDHHLSEVSYVKNVAVVPKYYNHKVQQLVAFIVPKEHEFTKDYQLTKAIKNELKEKIMDYMIPQKYIYVNQLPLTQNGKVDRKGLIQEVNSE